MTKGEASHSQSQFGGFGRTLAYLTKSLLILLLLHIFCQNENKHCYGFFPKQVYLYGFLTPFKGLHPWAA
jgi:hypothetical protein